MAKGAISKNEVFNKVMEVFPGSFMYNDGKELRIPMMEDGEVVQIKMTLTAAKTAVEPGEDTAVPGVKETKVTITEGAEPVFEDVSKTVEPSVSELAAVATLMESLGL